MATKNIIKKHEASEISVERASNGWIVTGKYDNLYGSDVPKSEICRTIPEMLEAIKKFASVPYIEEEEGY